MAKIEYMTNAFQSDLKPRARLVLNCLALHANKDGQCFPSIKTIAKECGYSVNTVKRALDDLVQGRFVIKEARFDMERKHGGQTSNLFTLNVVQPKNEDERPSKKVDEQVIKTDEKFEKQVQQEPNEKPRIKGELGVVHVSKGVVTQVDTQESTREIEYPYYNFSWAGEEPKGASP